jgi:hypothetical protein
MILGLCFSKFSWLSYYNHDRWRIGDESVRMLYDKPVEITEIIYNGIADSSLNPHAKETNNYQFNSTGELTYKKTSRQSDSFWTITKSVISENGYQSIQINHSEFNQSNDTSIVRSRILKTGQFLQTNFWTHIVSFYYLKVFEDNGNIEKTIAIADTNTFKKIIWTEISCYRNDLIQSHQIIQGNENSIETYFYSSRNFLDSIYIRSNGKLTNKGIFINNEQGDVEKYLSIKNSNDTFLISTYKYEYDEHKNWIKRWQTTNDKRKENPMHFFYLFSEREIKYSP